MAIRQSPTASHRTPKIHLNIHRPILLINHILPIDQLNPTWDTHIATIARLPSPRIRPALQSRTRRPPRHFHRFVAEHVTVRVTSRFDNGAGVAGRGRDGGPGLARGPVVGAGYVEEPIALGGDDPVNVRDLFRGIVEAELRSDNVGGRGVGYDEFAEGCAFRDIVLGAGVVDFKRFGENARF